MTFLRSIIFLLFTVTISPIKHSDCHPSPTGITLDLVHRDHVLSPQLSRFERLRQMVQRDMQILASSRKRRSNSIRRQTLETASTSLTPGANFGIGQYIMKLKIGTPPQEVLMIPDTGGDLSMLRCSYNGKNMSTGLLFDADKSSSFAAVLCESDLCSDNLTFMAKYNYEAECDGKICSYSNYGYDNGLTISGIFANETFTFAKNQVLKNIPIGCSTYGKKLNVINGTHGILGLNNCPMSFPTFASRLFGTVFSMCLTELLSDNVAAGTFTFGKVSQGSLRTKMSYTALDITSFGYQRWYGLNISAVYVNGTRMNIESWVWDNTNMTGGTIVNTGMAITVLNSPAYKPITVALNQSLSKFMNPVDDADSDFEFCYNSTGYKETLVPKLEIEFADGAKLEPDPKSYLIDFDLKLKVKCLAFRNAEKFNATYTTIGSILLQEHFVEFDVDNLKFGFGKSVCTTT